MSCFDTVIIKCPKCGTPIHFQSKSGGCYLNEYSHKSVPLDVAVGVIGETEYCPSCGHPVTLQTNTKTISLFIED